MIGDGYLDHHLSGGSILVRPRKAGMTMGQAGAWRCTVCGYIHRGTEPPAVCPVCGAGREVFEPHVDEIKPAATAAHAWRCVNCTYVHLGPKAPDTCPVCGEPSDKFRPADTGDRVSKGIAESLQYVVVGGGVAGVSAAESIRQASPAAEITVISKEEEQPYYRLNLTRYLAGEIGKEVLPLHPEDWYEEQRIDLRRGVSVDALDVNDGRVTVFDGEPLSFDRLILAAGAHPFIPPIVGSHRDGVVSLRTVGDADEILEAVRKGARCLVLGGGLLGLETAGALAMQGAEVHVIEGFGWLLPRQLNSRAGELLARHVESKRISLHMGVKVKEIVGDECVRGVELDGQGVVEGELLVMATGVRSNSYLARKAGLDVNQGVIVDNRLCTSHRHVYAAGDIAEHQGVVYGTWGPSQYQGSIAGMNAAGELTEFGGIPRSNTLKVLGVDMFSIGVVTPSDASYTEIVHETSDGKYFRFLFRDSLLVGAILLGDAKLTATVTRLVEGRVDLSNLLQKRPEGREVVEGLGEIS